MNDGRRPPRRRIGAANWALAGVVALCLLLSVGHLEDWASPSSTAASAKILPNRMSGTDVRSRAAAAAASDSEARCKADAARS